LFFGLTWLGMQRIHAPVGQGAAIDVSNKIVSSSAFIEASNPKSMQFYCSFLLQFTDPDASLGLGWQLFLLGACANLLFSADLPCILLTHPLHARVSPQGRALCLISRCAAWSVVHCVLLIMPFLCDAAVTIGGRTTVDDMDIRMRVHIADPGRERLECLSLKGSLLVPRIGFVRDGHFQAEGIASQLLQRLICDEPIGMWDVAHEDRGTPQILAQQFAGECANPLAQIAAQIRVRASRKMQGDEGHGAAPNREGMPGG
jgi:hypothetical protein